MLCLSCQGIRWSEAITVDSRPSTWEPFEHSTHLASVREAAFSGCQLCNILCRHFDATPESQPVAELCLKYAFMSSGLGKSCIYFQYNGLRVPLCDKTVDIVSEIDFVECISTDKTIPTLGRGNSRTSTSSERCLKQVQTWLNDCSKTHHRCNLQPSNGAWWPSRLIEITDSKNGFYIRLLETANAQHLGPYVTLSHCWGTAEFLRLTIQNYEGLKAGFSIDTLPKTFQDAILVAKRLHHRYIWIDSLCIIQNSVDDWRREASLMSEVYQHAIFNIAATHASDSSQGLFTNRLEPTPCMVQVPRTAITRTKLVLKRLGVKLKSNYDTMHLQDPDIWTNLVESAPLLKRGWVVQERLLARRVLHFSKGEVFWECREMRACETYPEKMPESVVIDATIKDLVPPFHSQGMKDRLWLSILYRYSSAKLTRTEDKEAAIIGVVNVLEKVFEDTYVAGLWIGAIPTQLLWRCDTEDVCLKSVQHAPTWSWLSLDGRVVPGFTNSETYEDNRELYTVDVEDIILRRKGNSPISPIVSGRLRLRGVLHPVTWNDDSGMVLDIYGLPPLGKKPTAWLDSMKTRSFPDRSYYCVVVLLESEGGRVSGTGLILEFLSEGVYERVGCFFSTNAGVAKLVSARRRGMLEEEILQRTEPYEYFPFETHYSADGCETKVTRKVSARELQERAADTEEVLFTII